MVCVDTYVYLHQREGDGWNNVAMPRSYLTLIFPNDTSMTVKYVPCGSLNESNIIYEFNVRVVGS